MWREFFGADNVRRKADPIRALDLLGADVVVDDFLTIQRITLPETIEQTGDDDADG